MTKQFKTIIFYALFIVLACSVGPSFGQDSKATVESKGGVFDIPAPTSLPAATNTTKEKTLSFGVETHPVLYLTPDKSEMIKLNQEAASVIVGNPNSLSVMLDTPDTLVVIPRAQGASYFTVMGKDGSILMQRHAIVSGKKENYVRIRRSCANTGSAECRETSVYFCPDICHEVSADQNSASNN